MFNRLNHPANLGRVIMNDRTVQFAQPQSDNSSLLSLISIDCTSNLRNFQPGHKTPLDSGILTLNPVVELLIHRSQL